MFKCTRAEVRHRLRKFDNILQHEALLAAARHDSHLGFSLSRVSSRLMISLSESLTARGGALAASSSSASAAFSFSSSSCRLGMLCCLSNVSLSLSHACRVVCPSNGPFETSKPSCQMKCQMKYIFLYQESF